MNNVFEGENSLLDYLNPGNIVTPLVELPAALNPFRKDGVRIFAKLMNALPLANMKSVPAYNMLLREKNSGGLQNKRVVIENSSGNTVFSLAVIARTMGIPVTKAIVSHEVSRGKLNLLRFLGTEVIVNKEPICPDPSDTTSGIYKAKLWAKENDWFNPGQYDNEANPESHYKWTGPQIWEQTKGAVSLVAAGLGTTGSAVGISKFLKEKNGNIEILGVVRVPNNPVPGVRTQGLLKEIAFGWKGAVDHTEEIGSIESFKKSLELCRHGLMVGPSSGFALAGLLKHLEKQNLEKGGERIAVFICPDSPFPYIDEYFEYLGPRYFPSIENEHLLPDLKAHTQLKKNEVKELSPVDAYKQLYNDNPDVLWEKVRKGEPWNLKDDVAIFDLRTESEFEEHHIPGSQHISISDVDKLARNRALKKKRLVLFVCKFGNTSRLAAWKASEAKISAISLKGGDAEWSRLSLPRERATKCVQKFKL